jgi:hypothetical protein
MPYDFEASFSKLGFGEPYGLSVDMACPAIGSLYFERLAIYCFTT